MVEETEKLVASWDTYEIMKGEVEYRLENWEDFGYDEKPDEDDIWQEIQMDGALFDFCYESELANLTDVVRRLCPDGRWHAEGRNMGWQHRSAESDFEDITDGKALISKCLGNGGDYHWWVWEDGDGLKVRVTHHDAPMGEWYYWKPKKPWFENVPVRA